MITIAVPREPEPETRVALVPDAVRKLRRAGHLVVVEKGAGALASFGDDDYAQVGAELVDAVDLSAVDIVVHVSYLPAAALERLREGAVIVGMIGPPEPDRVAAALGRRVTALGFERLPRTSRAQAMDALSSQAFAAGYRCVLEAAVRLPRFFPLAMTAAGTIPPANVVVLGVGVAGLQAIATARRLGAVVSANDIRPDSAEEVRSVGAEFIDVGITPAADAGGYARDLEAEAARRQQDILAEHIAGADVLITTAAVPGRPAPRLVSATAVAAMRPGSVVVDLAAATGGNVEGSTPGVEKQVPCTRGGGSVTVLGVASAPSDMPIDASRLFARNVAEVLTAMLDDEGTLVVKPDDDLLAGMCLTDLDPQQHPPHQGAPHQHQDASHQHQDLSEQGRPDDSPNDSPPEQRPQRESAPHENPPGHSVTRPGEQ